MERQTHLFDAKGKVLGRLATDIATVLSGKNAVDYTPHIDRGNSVVVINAADVHVTGTKELTKTYHHYTGYAGGVRTTTVQRQRAKDASEIIRHAVAGMLPKNKLGRAMQKRLFIYNDATHAHHVDVTHAA